MNTFDILFAVTSGLMGLVGGWLLRQSIGPALPLAQSMTAEQQANAELRESIELRRSQVASAVDRVKSLTMRVAANVQDHDTVLQQARVALDSPDSDGEIKAAVMELAAANEKMRQQLSDAKIRMEEQAAQLQTAEERARTDALTQLHNRRAFDEYMQQQYSVFQRSGTPSALMLVDVDHFKEFNDSHGHLAGDHVLKCVAELLRARLGDQAFVARYGGEEFAIVFAGREAVDVEHVAEEARVMIGKKMIRFEGSQLNVSVSGGLAGLEEEESVDRWVERADEGLYAAKEAGRNCAYRMEASKAYSMTKVVAPEEAPVAAESDTPAWLAEVTEPDGPSRPAAKSGSSAPAQSREELVVHRDVFGGMQPPDAIADLPAGEELLKIGRRQLHNAGRQGTTLSALSLRIPNDDEQLINRVVRALEVSDCSVDRYGMLTTERMLAWLPDTSEEEARRRVGVIHELLARSPVLPQLDSIEIGMASAYPEEEFEAFVERLIDARVQVAAAG